MIRSIILSSAFALLLCSGCSDSKVPDDGMDAKLQAGGMANTPFMSDGTQQPELHEAGSAGLADDAPVIGVIVDGEARAYSVTAMSGVASHVVNDLFGDKPVSVTYCDRTDCTRVFTANTSGQAIPLKIGGFVDEELQLMFDNQMYDQSSQALPLDDFHFESTTWGDWIRLHPGSRVFQG